MHDYKLKTSLKISLLRVNDHARIPESMTINQVSRF